jgi:hypothetical protein
LLQCWMVFAFWPQGHYFRPSSFWLDDETGGRSRFCYVRSGSDDDTGWAVDDMMAVDFWNVYLWFYACSVLSLG